ncbi:uncharacterized protein A4U43_C02F21660 [Asparagus officinalis]|uniref:DUF659 domain-containing protein n=1 Tax=Asparagus officinalis TaxID=4686 RepID=A0A5P1FLV4_ASPOF|nr:uncharacterized protein A4U43_C02F21660 [Asparagus officinalis]
MSQSSSFDGEPSGTDVGTMEFPGVGEANFVFENKNLIYTEEYQMQNELRSQLEKESQTDTSATILWKHVVKGRKCGNAHGGSHVFKCKHCQKIYRGTYTRVYAHLMGHKKGESKGIGYCSVVKADKNLQQQIKREVEQVESSPNVFPLKKSKTSSCSVMASHEPSLSLSYTGSFDKVPPMQDRNDVDSKVVRCFCANGIPFTVLRSPYWEEMVSAISKEPYYKSPSCDRAHTILKNERNTIEREFDEFKKKWTQYGISIDSNGWRKAKKQTLINFFASNHFGSMFLRALNFLVVEKAQKSVSHYILEAIENMGPNIVIQFIIDNAAL